MAVVNRRAVAVARSRRGMTSGKIKFRMRSVACSSAPRPFRVSKMTCASSSSLSVPQAAFKHRQDGRIALLAYGHALLRQSRHCARQHREQPLHIRVGGPQVRRHPHRGTTYRDMHVLGRKLRWQVGWNAATEAQPEIVSGTPTTRYAAEPELGARASPRCAAPSNRQSA